jgi:hypothetical protein
MPVVPRPFPPALPHGELTEVLPDVFFVTGSVKMPPGVQFSRNMTVVREGERLVLVNTVRLDERGLAALDKLGQVTDVLRIAGNHGSDDPFYADRYGAKVTVVKGQRYTAGFNADAPDTYFTPHAEADATGPLPIAGANLVVLRSHPPEGLLFLERHGGVLVAGDCLQNISRDRYFNLLASVMMPLLGFMRPYNVGPAWLKNCKPPKDELRGLLDLSFANVFPAHGAPVIGNARELYRPIVERVSRA